MYVFKMLVRNRMRFVLTVAGIALCTILMLLLPGIYNGARTGSVEYIRKSNADLWILQRHCRNILRSNSYLPLNLGPALEKIPGVQSVSPVFFLLASIETGKSNPSLYLTGYLPESGMGGPPRITEGKNVSANDEIVLDRSFARKYNFRTGDQVRIKNDTLKVVGLSEGTNMFVIQYAFITLDKAFSIAGIRNYVSCFQASAVPGTALPALTGKIEGKLGNTSVFDKKTFLENNIAEMESGILPLLFAVALIASVVLTAILSLILTIYILEKREDYASMKAFGAPGGFIPALVVKQSVFLTASGFLVGMVLFFPFESILEALSPEISAKITVSHFVAVAAMVLFISILSIIMPCFYLKSVYPMEVFK